MSFWKKEKKEVKLELTLEERGELLKGLVRKHKEEMVAAQVQAWMYLKETIKPVHMGKAQAESALATYQKRIKYCEENALAIELYAEEHDIKL